MDLYRFSAPILLSAAMMSGCGQEYDLSTFDEAGEIAASNEVGAARATVDQTFELDATVAANMADYLFVIDSSASMSGILKDVRAGMRSLGEGGFPVGTKIAVMTTTPAALDGSGAPFAAVVDQNAAEIDPGFQKLIDGEGMVTWKNANAAEKFTSEGCDGGWFSPSDKNANGVPCVLAITTIPLYQAGAEAGLVAVKQFLQTRGDEALFRDGAAANIVFISDTHDPGMGDSRARDRLIEFRPDWNELQGLVNQHNVVSSLRVHAIAPKSQCVESEAWEDIGTSYFDVAEASGGAVFDICETTNYASVFRTVVETGAKAQVGVLSLEKPASEIVSVEVDGVAAAYSVKRDGKVVQLDGKLPARNASVKVTYR